MILSCKICSQTKVKKEKKIYSDEKPNQSPHINNVYVSHIWIYLHNKNKKYAY